MPMGESSMLFDIWFFGGRRRKEFVKDEDAKVGRWKVEEGLMTYTGQAKDI